MSVDSSIQVTSYAQTCQVVHLLGLVVNNINPAEAKDDTELDFTYEEAQQLHRAATALLALVNSDYQSADFESRVKTSVSKALLYTALMNLHFYHCCIEGDVVELGGEQAGKRADLQKLALDTLDSIAAEILQFAEDLQSTISVHGLSWMSPLIIDCLYQGAVHFAWTSRESCQTESLGKLRALRGVLATIDERWKVAGNLLHFLINGLVVLIVCRRILADPGAH